MYALHVICHQIDGIWTGFDPGNLPDEGWCQSWIIEGDPYCLANGWLYCHETSRKLSTLAVRILTVQPIANKPRHVGFRVKRFHANGHEWRGNTPKLRRGGSHSGIVDATLEHELSAQRS